MKRKNLHLLTDTQVRKIHVVAGSASGVVLQNAAGEQTIRANREIILSAGAIGSPQLLEVSGIGSAPILEKAGVALVHHLPGVGENLIDHLQTRLSLKARNQIGRAHVYTPVTNAHLECRLLLAINNTDTKNSLSK